MSEATAATRVAVARRLYINGTDLVVMKMETDMVCLLRDHTVLPIHHMTST